MKAENYTERRDVIDRWPVNIVTYGIGDTYYCTIENVDPGARIARADGATREEVERAALAKAQRYLKQTRTFPFNFLNSLPRVAAVRVWNKRKSAQHVAEVVRGEAITPGRQRLQARVPAL